MITLPNGNEVSEQTFESWEASQPEPPSFSLIADEGWESSVVVFETLDLSALENNEQGVVGEELTVEGNANFPSNDTPESSIPVSGDIVSPSGSTISVDAFIDTDGNYSISFTPQETGEYEVQASNDKMSFRVKEGWEE